MRRALLRSPTFVRGAKRLLKKNPTITAALQSVLVQLENDAFAPSLKTHKLKGELTGSYACSAGYDLRVVFELVQHNGAEALLLASIGSHDEVY